MKLRLLLKTEMNFWITEKNWEFELIMFCSTDITVVPSLFG